MTGETQARLTTKYVISRRRFWGFYNDAMASLRGSRKKESHFFSFFWEDLVKIVSLNRLLMTQRLGESGNFVEG